MSPQMADVLKTLLTLVLGPGSLLAGWLTLKKKKPLPPEVEAAEAAKRTGTKGPTTMGPATPDAGWREYAEDMKNQLRAELRRVEKARLADNERNERELAELRATLERVTDGRTADRRRLASLEWREELHFAFEDQLIEHINSEKGPPAPSRPSGLRTPLRALMPTDE